jgi:hypothetical protein
MIPVVLMTLLNRLRGLAVNWLPGRTLFWVSPVVGALAYVQSGDVVNGLTFTYAYVVWGTAPWGRWYDLGRLPHDYGREDVPPNRYEQFIIALSGGSDHLALFWRHFTGLLPGLAVLGYWDDTVMLHVGAAVVFGALFMLAYELGWRLSAKIPTVVGELQVGFLWGVMILLF